MSPPSLVSASPLPPPLSFINILTQHQADGERSLGGGRIWLLFLTSECVSGSHTGLETCWASAQGLPAVRLLVKSQDLRVCPATRGLSFRRNTHLLPHSFRGPKKTVNCQEHTARCTGRRHPPPSCALGPPTTFPMPRAPETRTHYTPFSAPEAVCSGVTILHWRVR